MYFCLVLKIIFCTLQLLLFICLSCWQEKHIFSVISLPVLLIAWTLIHFFFLKSHLPLFCLFFICFSHPQAMSHKGRTRTKFPEFLETLFSYLIDILTGQILLSLGEFFFRSLMVSLHWLQTSIIVHEKPDASLIPICR